MPKHDAPRKSTPTGPAKKVPSKGSHHKQQPTTTTATPSRPSQPNQQQQQHPHHHQQQQQPPRPHTTAAPQPPGPKRKAPVQLGRPSSSTHSKPGSQGRVDSLSRVGKRRRPFLPIEHLLGEVVVNAAGATISPTMFVADDAIIGLYFAAKWCPPCRKLFPHLMLLYEELKKPERHVVFEMVYVSFDNNPDSFNEYLEKMPWWAVSYMDTERREDLAARYNVRGIPVFLLLNAKTLEVINKDGRLFVKVDPRGTKFPWTNMELPHPSPRPSEAVAEALSALAAAAELMGSGSSSRKALSAGSASEVVPAGSITLSIKPSSVTVKGDRTSSSSVLKKGPATKE